MESILRRFYGLNVLTEPVIVRDIAEHYHSGMKLLVFGLGYDAVLWDALTEGNTYFVEDNREYIALNEDIDPSRIIYYDYKGISVERSFAITDEEILAFPVPEALMEAGPFDLIFVSGPLSYNSACPGRLLPLFWSRYLLGSKDTLVYVDDSERRLESHCIERFYGDCVKKRLLVSGGCVRIRL